MMVYMYFGQSWVFPCLRCCSMSPLESLTPWCIAFLPVLNRGTRGRNVLYMWMCLDAIGVVGFSV